MKWLLAILIGLPLATIPLTLVAETQYRLAHESHNSNDEKSTPPGIVLDEDGFEVVSSGPSKEQLKRINELYLKSIKPIFKQKCLNCHGMADKLPWYAKLPGPKQLIQKDIREAKEHMDMSNGFPFAGHGTAIDDLEALERTLKEDLMPPFRYLMMHWKSSLTDKDKETIRSWIEDSKTILNNEGENNE